VAREFVARLASDDTSPDRGDIYNGGAALSGEALKAYMAARGDELVFLRRDVEVATQLHPALRQKFVFPMRRLRMVAAMAPSAGTLEELFVYVGRALFKGFEKQGGLAIYEMVSRDNLFFSFIAEHHAGEWMTEHEQGLAPEASEVQLAISGAKG
jgi:hypothetical protein